MAEECGDHENAKTYMQIFGQGKRYLEEKLFNGEYYGQNINLNDKSILKSSKEALDYYWNDEHKEIKYQIGEGCGIDQVLAQWHANLCGLGEIFDRSRTRKALKAIYKHNFRRSFREFSNSCRLYALNDEAGTLMFAWPNGKRKPVFPVRYAEETMHGFEYQVASHMIMEGMLKKGCELVKAIRDRYDGEKRNPWNEIECGSNYARSMASYALLNAFSGFHYNLAKGLIGFNPPNGLKPPMKFFWSLGTGWGLVRISSSSIVLEVLYGKLKLSQFRLPSCACKKKKAIPRVKTQNAYVKLKSVRMPILTFTKEIVIAKGDKLFISLS